MTQEIITRIKLIASEGYVLTNNETFGKEIFLGTGDKPENWYEITETEYKEILKKQEENIQE